jgi:hypothetical protein
MRRAADTHRRVADARRAVGPQPGISPADAQPTVILRIAHPDDAKALASLAELDQARALASPVLVAEVSGSPIAALSLSDFRVIANPFEPSAALVQLLLVRARQLQRAEQRTTRPRLSRLRALLASR